jgi:hypothetical protein
MDSFGARVLSKNKPCTRGRQTKKGRRENATDLGVVEWRIPVGRAERAGDREGMKEGDAGADRNVDEGEEEENDNDGERGKNRRAEERTREEGGKGEGRGNARGGGEKASRKGEGRKSGWRRPPQQHVKTRERGEEGRDRRQGLVGGSAHHAKNGEGEFTR